MEHNSLFVPASSLTEILKDAPNNSNIIDNVTKAYTYINRPNYKTIVCSISGGADSDIVLDICARCDKDNKITYVFFDTGIEYKATKEHLDYLETRYNIKIQRFKSAEIGKCIPTSCKQYGQPFVSKFVSECIQRLQRHNFKWEDKPFDELYSEYPKCKSALNWWCNKNGNHSSFNISNNKLLKEFMIENPPNFKISNKCCKYSKKDVAHEINGMIKPDLHIIGVRKSEGGIRSAAYKGCFSNGDKSDQYRPIFWYKDSDKKDYEEHYNINHSKCYMEYGLKRTGCIGCPFGRNLEFELQVAKEHEPKIYKAVNNIFKDSYEYTKKYREYVRNRESDNQQVTIYDLFDDDNNYIY